MERTTQCFSLDDVTATIRNSRAGLVACFQLPKVHEQCPILRSRVATAGVGSRIGQRRMVLRLSGPALCRERLTLPTLLLAIVQDAKSTILPLCRWPSSDSRLAYTAGPRPGRGHEGYGSHQKTATTAGGTAFGRDLADGQAKRRSSGRKRRSPSGRKRRRPIVLSADGG